MEDDLNFKYYNVTENNPVFIRLEESDNNRFYHYTDEAGINGILKSNTLWVTNCYHLDDITEIKYMSKVLDGVIKLLEKQKYDDIIGGYIFNQTLEVLKVLRKAYKNGAPIYGGGIYILSLTENKDNQYLINNYCKQNGAIIEFKGKIDDLFIKNEFVKQYFSAKVVYGLIKQIQILIKDIDEFCNELLLTLYNQKSINYKEVNNTIVQIIKIKILNYSFYFKDGKYFKEEEYRVIFFAKKDNVKYKSVTKRPYVEVPFSANSINVRYI